MTYYTYLWTTFILIPICSGVNPLKLNRLTDLTPSEYDELFTPKYLDENRKHASHDIHILDDNGKFIDLSYQSKHSSNTNILKLNEKAHKKNINSISCTTDDNDNEIITLNFRSQSIAKRYHNDITSSLSHAHKKHFVSVNHDCNCMNSQNHIAPVLSEITGIKSNELELMLYTKPAKLVDVFEELSVSYSTNINSDETNHILGTHHTVPYTTDITTNNRRRLTGYWGRIWQDVKNGIESAVEYIKDVVTHIRVADVAEAVAAAAGLPVYHTRNITNTWSWNYNETDKHAAVPIEFSENLTCANCYTEFNITWTFAVGIKDRDLYYLLVSAEGDIEINSDLILSGKYDNDEEYREQTAKQPLPDLSFEVAGIGFDVNIYGEMGIGVQTNLTAFAGGFKVTGVIKKGLEYNESNTHDQYNYINENGNLNHELSGPRSEFASGDILHYARPTLYMEVTHIGDFYFGIQPTFDLKLTRDDYRKTCVVHYAPSTKLNTFIGADLEITNWHKKMDFTAGQSNIEDVAGCIDKSQIIENQLDIIDIMKSFGDEDWWEWTHDNDSNWFRFDDITGLNRRLMDDWDDTDTADTSTYLNYSNMDLSPKFSDNDRWDDRSLQWWGNLSTISDVCDDWNVMCDAYDIKAVKPHIGTLEVSRVNDSILIGIYRTVIEIIPSVHWDFQDALMMTNISCIARHQFDLMQDTYGNDGIRTFYVTLLEWYCDTELSNLGINENTSVDHIAAWECMIRLPLQMSAMSLDAALGSIVLFDSGSDWCHVFILTTKPQYLLHENDIDWGMMQYPSKLWYGIWDCEQLLKESAKETELYIMDYNHSTSETNVVMYLNEDTFYLHGYIDLENMTMQLVYVDWDGPNDIWNGTLHFIGVLEVFYDGTMIYAGSIEYEGCTGFLFQGYLNLTQFEYMYVHEGPVENIRMEDDAQWISNVVIMTFFIGMITSVVIMASLAGFCYFYTSKKKRNCTPNYGLMEDYKL